MSDDLSRRLAEVAETIPATPRGFGQLRQMIRTLPPLTPTSLPGTSGALLPDTGQQETSEQQGSPTAGALGGGTPGSVGPGSITPGSLPVASFAASIIPPRVVTALPTLPSASWPQGSLVFLTTDAKLYRNTDGSTWSAAVAGGDVSGAVAAALMAAEAAEAAAVAAAGIVGQIIETQIADDAISTPKLQASAVVAGKIAAGAVETAKLAAGAVDATKIAAGAVTTDKLDALAVTAEKIAADTITAGQIAAGAIGASEIAADAVTADKIATGAVRVASLASQLPGGNLVANPSFELVGPGYSLGEGSGIGDALTTANVDANLPGWTAVDVPTGGRVSVADTSPGHGKNRLGIQAGNPIATGRLWSDYIPVVPGQTLKASMLLRGSGGNVGTANGALWLRWYKADKTVSSTTESAILPNYNVGSSGTWVRREGSVTVPSDAYFMRVTIVLSASSSADVFIAYDDVRVFAPADLTNNSGEVLIDSSGIAVTNGKITVTNPGSTVVIDGTSNMFKIAATGTLTKPNQAAAGSSSASATINTGLTYRPMTLWAFFDGTNAIPMFYANWATGSGLVGNSLEGFAELVLTSQTKVWVVGRTSGSLPARDARYYILKEAAI